MPKAKLSQIASTWVDEDTSANKKDLPQEKKRPEVSKKTEDQLKKKQTFSLKIETIKRLWAYRVKTNKTISKTIDELVAKHIPD